jgi:hypothetical protein
LYRLKENRVLIKMLVVFPVCTTSLVHGENVVVLVLFTQRIELTALIYSSLRPI